MNGPASEARFVRPFATIGLDDVALVGGKNASLGELYRELHAAGVRVPNGFAVTADAYRATLEQAGAWPRLRALFDGLDADDLTDLAARAAQARDIVSGCPLPLAVQREVSAAYDALVAEYGSDVSLAVRSSATAEDAPTASFAGQQETYLNITGPDALTDAIRHCFASLFTDRSIHYRIDQGFSLLGVAMSVGCQKMVRSDLATSGIMFSLDPETGFRDVVVVSACYGFGENIVQGAIVPDDFTVFKPTFRAGHRAVLRRSLGTKRLKMVTAPATTDPLAVQTVNVATSEADQQRFCVSDAEVLELAGYALAIEDHWSARAGRPVPVDIEWAKDGLDGSLWIVQARPETVASQRQANLVQTFRLRWSGPVAATGRSVGTRIGSGRARVIATTAEIGAFQPGEVLVTDATTPDWEPVMKRAAAIVTDRGGRTCHAAIVARELGIPAVVGCGDATARITTGEMLTVSCAEGETGNVYRGELAYEVSTTDTATLPRPRTKVMLIIGNPDTAFSYAALPNDGVGLCRMEFVITEYIKAHPMALVHPELVSDAAERDAIEELARGYPDPAAFFIERLSEGIGTIAAAFYPKPVIVRLSDFKTNEYATLIGGRGFEPVEANPMLGFRGASRYTHPAYADGFALECAALRRARETLGLTNIKVMIPFCRRVAEARATVAKMASLGLTRGENGLEVYLMCEIPNNVISIDAFSEVVDGFSIGSNDLTQLTLGVDRDSELVAFDFDERDPGVLAFIGQAVEGCRRNGKHSGICGQAPSDYPEVAEALVAMGIDSISLNPDAIVTALAAIARIEAGTIPVAATV